MSLITAIVVHHRLTLSALLLLHGLSWLITSFIFGPQAMTPSPAIVETAPIVQSSHLVQPTPAPFPAPETLPPGPGLAPLETVSSLSYIVLPVSENQSQASWARHRISIILCQSKPPFVRSRMAVHAYYGLFVVRRELCGPQLSFLDSIPRPSKYIPFRRAAPAVPHLPPLATRVVSANVPPTKVWSLATGNLPPLQPAYARAHRRVRPAEGLDNAIHIWEEVWGLRVWRIFATVYGTMLVLTFWRLKPGSWCGWKRERLFAAPPITQVSASAAVGYPGLPLPSSKASSALSPWSIVGSIRSIYHQKMISLLTPGPALAASLAQTMPAVYTIYPSFSDPDFTIPPPPPPPTRSRMSGFWSPRPPARRVKYHYVVQMQGYRGESPDLFCRRVRTLNIHGQYSNRAWLENYAWQIVESTMAWLDDGYQKRHGAHFKTRVRREVEIYELSRKPSGKLAWTKNAHQSQIFDSIEQFRASVENCDQRSTWPTGAVSPVPGADRTRSHPRGSGDGRGRRRLEGGRGF
ncbi:hypothetical protein RhiJN_01719 [Ceratobasidium sp. AG-Ba]|nr:hypothetical protein RhiJN_01719 [Ceratobasidium sp. AG-Ba]QRW02646.1 hypothetical protein RhiLY_01645 [Ceratobasidium sp. AG-Ba]